MEENSHDAKKSHDVHILFITAEQHITEYQVNQMVIVLFTRTTRYQGYLVPQTA